MFAAVRGFGCVSGILHDFMSCFNILLFSNNVPVVFGAFVVFQFCFSKLCQMVLYFLNETFGNQ